VSFNRQARYLVPVLSYATYRFHGGVEGLPDKLILLTYRAAKTDWAPVHCHCIGVSPTISHRSRIAVDISCRSTFYWESGAWTLLTLPATGRKSYPYHILPLVYSRAPDLQLICRLGATGLNNTIYQQLRPHYLCPLSGSTNRITSFAQWSADDCDSGVLIENLSGV
jgi:hypothetical protein